MTKTGFNRQVTDLLDTAWNRDSAAVNMDRWLSVCEKEGWGSCPENLQLLTKLFGASWYFTRFVFFRGREVLKYFDEPLTADFSVDAIYTQLLHFGEITDLEQKFDQLRINKNEIMLRIFLAQLNGNLLQEQVELALTNLAETTLKITLDILGKEHRYADTGIAIIAMGRMAGREMNYGSDLDLIFLYTDESGGDTSILIKRIQLLLRHIALPTPFGILYEIDMRLRPHGTSGTLISPARYFIEYHQGKREIWERQMMTRCRAVIDPGKLASKSITAVTPVIYGEYDGEFLRNEIIGMRKKVQQELGNPGGKYEIKRGYGAIMDIDFLTHYLQLLHGHKYPRLQTASTRNAIRQLEQIKIISADVCSSLLRAYDYMKRIEGVLRVMDLKSVSAFPRNPESVHTLARAMGHLKHDEDQAAKDFLEKYINVAHQVRRHFNDLVGEI